MWIYFLLNLQMGASPVGSVTIDAYPDPFAATATAALDPFAATCRYKGT